MLSAVAGSLLKKIWEVSLISSRGILASAVHPPVHRILRNSRSDALPYDNEYSGRFPYHLRLKPFAHPPSRYPKCERRLLLINYSSSPQDPSERQLLLQYLLLIAFLKAFKRSVILGILFIDAIKIHRPLDEDPETPSR